MLAHLVLSSPSPPGAVGVASRRPTRRRSPAGNPEVEAAHIYPKKEGGSDDDRNGLALCKFHHWTFDTGWISVTDSHRIIVLDKPDAECYDDPIGFDGERLTLPREAETRPRSFWRNIENATDPRGTERPRTP